MRITVCEFPDETRHKGAAWSALSDYLNSEPAEVVVLPEMPFADWSVFMEKEVDLAVWKNTLDSHREMEQKLGDLNTGIVLGSRPIQIAEQRLNQAFVWTRDDGCRGVRVKYYLPDEPVGWEATWFDQRDLDFASTPVGNLNVGFQICTEMLLSERSREIGASGGQLIAAPRATANHAAGQLPREWPRLCLVVLSLPPTAGHSTPTPGRVTAGWCRPRVKFLHRPRKLNLSRAWISTRPMPTRQKELIRETCYSSNLARRLPLLACMLHESAE